MLIVPRLSLLNNVESMICDSLCSGLRNTNISVHTKYVRVNLVVSFLFCYWVHSYYCYEHLCFSMMYFFLTNYYSFGFIFVFV